MPKYRVVERRFADGRLDVIIEPPMVYLDLRRVGDNWTDDDARDWRIASITPNGDGTATLITPQGRSYPITPYDYRDL